MSKRKTDDPTIKVRELICFAESVLEQARLVKDGSLSLRALGELRELHLAASQIRMAIDEKKALATIGDGALIAEVRRRGLVLDQKVIWEIKRDASPPLPSAEESAPALPEGAAAD